MRTITINEQNFGEYFYPGCFFHTSRKSAAVYTVVDYVKEWDSNGYYTKHLVVKDLNGNYKVLTFESLKGKQVTIYPNNID